MQHFLLLASLTGALTIVAIVLVKLNDRYWDAHFSELEESELYSEKGDDDEPV